MAAKQPEVGSARYELRKQLGFDVKFAYHVVRLLSECEQILAEGDLDLQEKGRREHMKAIRRGDVSEDEIRQWAADKERQLEQLYHASDLPNAPEEAKIRQLLMNCLEQHYGSLSDCVIQPDEAPIRTQVPVAIPARRALAAIDRRLKRHAVADGQLIDRRAGFDHLAGDLVAENSGRRAAERLLLRLRRKRQPRAERVRLDIELRVRRSVGPPPPALRFFLSHRTQVGQSITAIKTRPTTWSSISSRAAA